MRAAVRLWLVVCALLGAVGTACPVVGAAAYSYDASADAWTDVAVANGGVPSAAVARAGSGVLQAAKHTYDLPASTRSCTQGAGATKWELTKEGSSKILQHNRFGKFYKSASDGTWWVKDTAGHGGSAFKVYRETSKGLEWIADADECGDYIEDKHKGPTGKSIPWSELHS